MRLMACTRLSAMLICSWFVMAEGCHSAKEAAEKQAAQARQEQRNQEDESNNQQILQLAQSDSAITDWQEPAKHLRYTIDAQSLFVREDRRPFLFYGMLEDVNREGDDTRLSFKTLPTRSEPSFQVVTRCGSCDLEEVKNPKHYFYYAVLTHVNQVRKHSTNSDEDPQYSLDGELVAVRYVGLLPLHEANAVRRTHP